MGTLAALTSDLSFGLGLLASSGAKVDVVGIYSAVAAGPQAPAPSGLASLLSSLGNNSVINSVLGKSSTTPGFGQQFVNARPMRATVRETSKVMEHPVETGSMIADHHIINPVEIDLPLIVQSQYYAVTYAQIRQNFINATLLTVKTRTGSYQNMIIADMPHEEDAEMYSAISIGLHLKQVLLYTPGATTLQSGYSPALAVNSNTVQSGLQQAVALTTKLGTTALSAASYLAVAGKKFL